MKYVNKMHKLAVDCDVMNDEPEKIEEVKKFDNLDYTIDLLDQSPDQSLLEEMRICGFDELLNDVKIDNIRDLVIMDCSIVGDNGTINLRDLVTNHYTWAGAIYEALDLLFDL